MSIFAVYYEAVFNKHVKSLTLLTADLTLVWALGFANCVLPGNVEDDIFVEGCGEG